MNYRDYIFADAKQSKKPWYSIVWKCLKLAMYLFLFISLLWGCGQIMASKYNVYPIVDANGKSVFKAGIFFEILVGSNTGTGKEHYFHIQDGRLYEYPFWGIRTWGEAFTKTQSPFYGFFVFPIAWVLIKLINGFGGIENGVGVLGAIFLTSLLVRLIVLAFSWKGQRSQLKMSSLQMKQAEIQAKYRDSKDPAAKQKQQMETMALYRKEGVSPFSAMASAFLTAPFLIAMFTVVRSTRDLKLTSIGQISLIDKPWEMITSGQLVYLSLLVIYFILQAVSMFLPTALNWQKTKTMSVEQKKQRKKHLIIQGVSMIIFVIFAINIAAGAVIYWIFSSFISIIQTLGFHYARKYKRKNKANKMPIIEKIKSITKKDSNGIAPEEIKSDFVIVTKKRKDKKKKTSTYAPTNKQKTKYSIYTEKKDKSQNKNK